MGNFLVFLTAMVVVFGAIWLIGAMAKAMTGAPEKSGMEAPQNQLRPLNNQGAAAPSKFEEVLTASVMVAAAYGQVLATPSPSDGFGPLRSDTGLPYPRNTIKQALEFLLATIGSAETRAAAIRVLSPEDAQYFLSDKYRISLAGALACLPDFVPEGDLVGQRETAKSIRDFMESPDSKPRTMP